MAQEFMGRRISKQLISLGIAGQIERGSEELPPRATVEFTAKATVSGVKHKFAETGTVEESTILTVVADSFAVLGVERAAEQPELPLNGGTVTVTETDAAAQAMGLKGPLLVACEACGHPLGDHAPERDGEGDTHVGRCLNPACQCEAYVAFAEPPAEEAMEPVTGEEVDHEMAVGAAGVQGALAGDGQ